MNACGRSLHFLADPLEWDALQQDDRFVPSSHHAHRRWMALRLEGDKIDWDEIAELLEVAYRQVASPQVLGEFNAQRPEGSSRPAARMEPPNTPAGMTSSQDRAFRHRRPVQPQRSCIGGVDVSLDRDWSVPAGTVEWSCTKTAEPGGEGLDPQVG